jgi:hypothetical protein
MWNIPVPLVTNLTIRSRDLDRAIDQPEDHHVLRYPGAVTLL